MSDTNTYASLDNYPDILGDITGNVRANIGVLQIATALRPRVAIAGKPLEMLLLLQNASDVAVEVVATLSLPAYDAKKQKGRFISKAERLIVTLEAAAVGLITLPLSTLPDTAVSADYKIGIDIKVAPLSKEKPNRIRATTGGGVVLEEYLPEKSRELMASLKKSAWSANVSGSSITANLTIMSGKVGAFADLQPSWTSLWTTGDYWDETFLLHRFSHVLAKQVIPNFVRPNIFPVIREYTEARFANVGYSLFPEETDTIARLLTLMLEYANPRERDMLYMMGEAYNVKQYFDENGKLIRSGKPITLPRWCAEMIRIFNRDERALQFPVKTVAHFAFDALLRDAMLHSFERIEAILSMDVGTLEERNAYIDHVFEAMAERKLRFDTLYMPLVIGGFALVDGVIMKDEKAQQIIQAMRPLLDKRFKEQTDDTMPVYQMAAQVLEQTANKYNFSEW
jgi:hypothetical protein